MVDKYEVMWEVERDHVARFHDTITDGSQSYTISELESDESVVYRITVTVFNSVGSTSSATLNIASDASATLNISSDAAPSSCDRQESECDTAAVAAGVGVGVFVRVSLAAAIIVIAFLKFYPKPRKEIPQDYQFPNQTM